jgi:hypothetical protein
MKRKDNGQFTRTQPWIPLFGATLLTTLGIQTLSMSLTNVKQEAEINYLKAYSKSIELQGLRHWNTMYDLSLHKYDQPKDVKQIIEFVFQDKAPEAIKVATCESGLNPKAENKKSSAVGTFQVLAATHDMNKKYLKDAFINTLVAKKLYDASGWTPWVSSISCHGVK